MAFTGSKDWVTEAPVSRMASLVVLGGPVAPCVFWSVILRVFECFFVQVVEIVEEE